MRFRNFILPLVCVLLCFAGCGSNKCPREGDAKGYAERNLNVLKNRNQEPKEINYQITTSDLKYSRDRHDFDESKGVTIEGYILKAKQEEAESCNCHSRDSSDWDFHIFLSDKPAHRISQCIVVEATPYTRSLHPDYTLAFFRSLAGKKVRITGWLMYDFEHEDVVGRYRSSLWEVHPITKVEVLEEGGQLSYISIFPFSTI
jgi:hypothetical protein